MLLQEREEMLFRRALKGAASTFILFPPKNFEQADAESILAYFAKEIRRHLRSEKHKKPQTYGLKYIAKLKVILRRYSDELRRFVVLDVWFGSVAQSVYTLSDIPVTVSIALREILTHYDNFVCAGSGWSLRKVIAMELTVARFRIIRGGCSVQDLPREIEKSRGIISLRNCPDGKCFHYSVAAAMLCTKKNPSRARQSKYQKVVSYLERQSGVLLFANLADVKRFQRKVKFISVNVYGFKKNAFPIQICEERRCFHVNLLYHKKHFYPVRNLGALIKKNALVSGKRVNVCEFCMAYFQSDKRFTLHQKLCSTKSSTVIFPSEEERCMSFRNYGNMISAPFAIYCDLESLISEKEIVNEKKLLSIRNHEAISAGALTVCNVDNSLSSQPFIYTGKDCIEKLFGFLSAEILRIDNIFLNRNVPLVMTERDMLVFDQQKECEMCNAPFSESLPKVRDHEHLTGKYRFALCNACNLTYAKQKFEVNIFFHGLSNYDSHFLIQQLNKVNCRFVRVVPQTSEKYLSFSIDSAHFKDSYHFVGAPLAVLVDNLKNKGKVFFTNLNQHIPDPNKRDLMFQKGIFPYSYLDSYEKLKEDQLPPIECFTSDLTNEHLSPDQYAFAQRVWKTMECKNLQDYMEIYLLCDVLLLADVFENFRSNSLKNYGLDPVHYFSTPHFTLDAFLKMSKISLELIMDVNQYLFIKKGMRGGLSMVSKRFSVANIPGEKGFVESRPAVFLRYFDANNLYGKCMTWPMPFSDFRWLEPAFLTEDFFLGLDRYGEFGCIIECDLEYPIDLHDTHHDYPLAPERKRVSFAELSPYAKKICIDFNLKSSVRTPKLMATLLKKENYVLHFWNFQLYVKLGLVVKKIHRAVAFTQRPFIREYIEFNSLKRAQATNNFDVQFYKGMCNQLYGKFMEDLTKRMKVFLCGTPEKVEKHVGDPCYKDSKIINSELVAVSCGYPAVKIKKPFYVGMCILELAKYHMYHFHYEVMKPVFGNALTVLYTDTDSFLYEISTTGSSIDREMRQLSESFDFSNYPHNHKLFSTKNKKVPGIFKDEAAGREITEFVGLRSKMYSFTFSGGEECKAAKGGEEKRHQGQSYPCGLSQVLGELYSDGAWLFNYNFEAAQGLNTPAKEDYSLTL